MTEIKIFKNAEFGSVRTVVVDGSPMFVGKDVAEILGYSNPSKALMDHVDSDDKLNNESLSSLGQRGGWLINESGLYSLILSSKMPNAKKFKRWVTSEVLPSIRKTGMYATDYLIDNPDIAIAALTALKEERARNKALTNTIAIQNQQIHELQPKASYYDVILSSTNTMSVSQIAKDYGKTPQWLNATLHELGVQFKQGKTWLLYKKYAAQGYTDTQTHAYQRKDGSYGSSVHTYWTQKGRLFIYDLLKQYGIVPVMEQEVDTDENI